MVDLEMVNFVVANLERGNPETTLNEAATRIDQALIEVDRAEAVLTETEGPDKNALSKIVLSLEEADLTRKFALASHS